jgi:hypothetical protein
MVIKYMLLIRVVWAYFVYSATIIDTLIRALRFIRHLIFKDIRALLESHGKLVYEPLKFNIKLDGKKKILNIMGSYTSLPCDSSNALLELSDSLRLLGLR